MGQVKGNMCTCDRCGKELFVADSTSSVESSNWRTIKRYTSDGTLVSRFVCLECNNEYKYLVSKEDTSFNNFMKNLDGE